MVKAFKPKRGKRPAARVADRVTGKEARGLARKIAAAIKKEKKT
jgi:hypothetical protein